MIRKVMSALLVLMLAGCNAAAPEQPASEPESGNHGCDAFEECEDEGAPASETALQFKESYEALNGVANSSGKIHRTITVSENHPFEKTDPKDVVSAIENGETFWLYFGDPKCPWCRSVLETSIRIAAEKGVTSIKYVEIWDAEGNEIVRDKYVLEDGKPVKEGDGIPEYAQLLKLLDPVLDQYELEDDDGNTVQVGEKRVYAPNYIRIENGKAVRLTTGIPEDLEDPRDELTPEMLADEAKQFEEFFTE